MDKRIPQRIDHYRYADKGVVLEGVITREESEKDLLRLKEAVVNISSDIEYYLEFDIDKLSNRIVSGFVKTQVVLQCQRCMKNFVLDIACDILLAFVQNDFEAKRAETSCNYEVFWLEEKEFLDPRILIEDELLLAIPHIPVHPDTNCQVQSEYLENQEILEQDFEQTDAENPFAVLKGLKK